MKLNLKKPIVFFDLETTGTNIATDRIVEISMLKVNPNESTESKTYLVNPTVPIPPEVTAIHGIDDERVKDKPTFKELASDVLRFLEGADLGGYNSNRFDVPLLAEEILRAGYDFDLKSRSQVDVQVIFHKMEQRTLSAAYKFYCNKILEDAHSAEADTMATYEVLLSQLDRYSELKNDVKWLNDFTARKNTLDLAGFIALNEDQEPIFTFGKYKNTTIKQVLDENPGYFGWIQNADFPLYTKKILTQLKLENTI